MYKTQQGTDAQAMKYSQTIAHQSLINYNGCKQGLGQTWPAKELLRTKQLFAVNVTRPHRLFS